MDQAISESGKSQLVRAWTPQPGPQLAAIEADWCDIVLFGGGKYGGKSDYLLGDFLQDVNTYGKNWQGILVRRSQPELEEIKARAQELFPQCGAVWKEQKSKWVFPNGAQLRFRQIEREADITKYQGHSYCVGVGTPILMADGTKKPIEEIRIGEMVATLSGPRKVLATKSPYMADCVEVLGQIQPKDHPILTASGWQSYASIQGSDSKEFESKGQAPHTHLSANVFARCLKRVFGYAEHPPLGGVSNESHGSCTPGKSSDASTQAHLRLVVSKPQASEQARESLLGTPRYESLRSASDEIACAQLGSGKAEDSPARCSSCRHLHGEPLQPLARTVPSDIPSPGGAEEPCREHCRLGALGSTQVCSQRDLESRNYSHPYTGQELSATEDSVFLACSMTPIGERLVADLTVDEVNHYINADNGLVNKNTWIGLDEAGMWPDESILRKFAIACMRWGRAKVDRKRIRLTANPGGIGHSWLKEFFIERNRRGFDPFVDERSGMSCMFIPSLITDNKMGLEKDPDYIRNLQGVGTPELVRAWLEGDWDAIQGACFSMYRDELHVLPDFTPPEHWFKFATFDWGLSEPFAVMWWTVSDGDDFKDELGRDRWMPRGALIAYREWYGCDPKNGAKGLRLRNEDVAQGIVERTFEELHSPVISDSLPFQDRGFSRGGKAYTVADIFSECGCPLIQGNTRRVHGTSQIISRLIGVDDIPMLYLTEKCVYARKYLPLVETDPKNPETYVDSGEPTHIVDCIKLACTARPGIRDRKIPKEIEWKDTEQSQSPSALIKRLENGRKRKRRR